MVTKAESNRKSDIKNAVQIKMKLSRNTDKDILDKLASLPNKQGYIKELIRADLVKEGNK